MTATFLVGDVRARMAELDDESFDLILCSPPFLALRSYLPDGHPDKHLEIGSEATPAEFLDTMLELTAEWGRLLAPHGSIAIELGDTYAGSGGAGGDYQPDGLRAGQNKFKLDVRSAERVNEALAKSLMGIPQLYQIAITYGINPLTGTPSPAGRWRVRNLKAWIRSNPPVGALGDKERSATSYIIVATRAVDRWFDLDAVRTPGSTKPQRRFTREQKHDRGEYPSFIRDEPRADGDVGGAPPRDWVHTVDLILDTELANRAGKTNKPRDIRYPGAKGDPYGSRDTLGPFPGELTQGAQGVHLRRALEHAGILHPQDFYDISPKGYRGAHYAVWPPELARRLIDEMCPRHVCLTCGEPRRRLVGDAEYRNSNGTPVERNEWTSGIAEGKAAHSHKPDGGVTVHRATVGWSDCGHGPDCRLPVYEDQFVPATYRDDGKLIARERTVPVMVDPGHCDDTHWRPGRVLDPFVGSGTTLAVATGMARDSVGIDLDARNATLAYQRVGMFLEVDGDMAQPDLTWENPDALDPIDIVEDL